MKTVKNIITLLIILLITMSSFAQNGINYKAIVKDGSGNVLASQLITVQFQIVQGVAQTNVYEELHTPTTDTNGLILLNIGEGILISGDYTIIDWASDTHFLNVQINTGGGLVDMGTTEFKTVPYALQADNATTAISALTALTANNVTGLETLDEGNGIGWRLVGKDPDNFGNIGENAVDLSNSAFATTSVGATGYASTALGVFTTASGDYATAMGLSTIASGDYATAMGRDSDATGNNSTAMGSSTIASGFISTAMGRSTIASGFASIAMGAGSNASGDYSTAMGRSTFASSYASMAIGRFNVGGGDPSNWVETDPLFEIGNGVLGISSKNALTVLKNGTHIMNSSIDANPEIILGGTADTATGDNGILSSDPNYSSSDIFLRSYDAVVIQLDYDNNEIGQFEIKNGAGTEVFEVTEAGNVSVNGTIVHASDRRLKKDIEDLQYGLTEILQLQPKAYNWKNRDQNYKSLGLIAQEVQPIIKEIVSEKDNKEKTLGISYVELIPILINAIKEQQEIIDNQDSEIKSLQSSVIGQQSEFDNRLKKIETLLNTSQQ